MSKSGIQPFSAGFSSYPSSFANVCTPSPPPTFSPFSEGISFFQAALPKEPPDVKRSFTNLRKAWLEERAALPAGKKPPTKGEIVWARKVLREWYEDLKKVGKATPEIRERIKHAMLVKPVSVPSAARLAKAEKIVKAIAKESGKKLAARVVTRYALRVIPFLGTALMVFPDVMEWIKSAKRAPATRKFIADLMAQPKERPEFSEQNQVKFHPRIPAGEYYHPSVGWY